MNEQMTVAYQLENETAADWKVTSGGETLINADTVKNYLNYTYGDFLCIQLYYKFLSFNSMQAADLAKALAAWDSSYNPISNYDKHETNIDIYNHGDNTKTTHSDDDHNTIKNVAISDADATHNYATTENYTTTFDSDTARKENETRVTGGNMTINDNHVIEENVHTQTTMAHGETTLYGDEIRKHENITEGNIGVMTTQQMIQSECDMRLNPVIKQYLDRFVFTYCIYIGGAWD